MFYLKNPWTQEQKRNQENTWSTAGLFCIYTISRIPRRRWPRCSWHTRHQNQMELTPTPMGHQDPTQPIDVSEDHVQHPIVWQLQMFRERETMITPSEQDQNPPSEGFLYICDYLCRKSQYHQLPLWDNRPRDHRSVEYAKGNPLLYYLLVYTGRTRGYIRTPIRVPSWVLRLQSYLVACRYLVDKYVTLCLIIT